MEWNGEVEMEMEMEMTAKKKAPTRRTIEVPDLIWAWAQKVSGKTQPGSFLREKLYEAMVAKSSEGMSAVMLDDLAAYDSPVCEEPVVTTDLSKRWGELRCSYPDPIDAQFNKAMEWYLSHYATELEALEYAEEKSKHGYENKPMGPGGMRRMILFYFKKWEAEQAEK